MIAQRCGLVADIAKGRLRGAIGRDRGGLRGSSGCSLSHSELPADFSSALRGSSGCGLSHSE
ncbi:MAG: hypothetical protein M3Z04_06205, partial [Chloroflexota bacterium]|nr:hypothetical protein [Chloroflexota bacterium]